MLQLFTTDKLPCTNIHTGETQNIGNAVTRGGTMPNSGHI